MRRWPPPSRRKAPFKHEPLRLRHRRGARRWPVFRPRSACLGAWLCRPHGGRRRSPGSDERRRPKGWLVVSVSPAPPASWVGPSRLATFCIASRRSERIAKQQAANRARIINSDSSNGRQVWLQKSGKYCRRSLRSKNRSMRRRRWFSGKLSSSLKESKSRSRTPLTAVPSSWFLPADHVVSSIVTARSFSRAFCKKIYYARRYLVPAHGSPRG